MSIETKSLDDLRARIALVDRRIGELAKHAFDSNNEPSNRSRIEFGAIVGFGQKGRYRLWMHCGWDESGDVSTHVVVPIDKELAMLLAQYLMTHGQLQHFMVASDFERSDDDGGEELPLPTVSEAELAAMVASVGVQ